MHTTGSRPAFTRGPLVLRLLLLAVLAAVFLFFISEGERTAEANTVSLIVDCLTDDTVADDAIDLPAALNDLNDADTFADPAPDPENAGCVNLGDDAGESICQDAVDNDCPLRMAIWIANVNATNVAAVALGWGGIKGHTASTTHPDTITFATGLSGPIALEDALQLTDSSGTTTNTSATTITGTTASPDPVITLNCDTGGDGTGDEGPGILITTGNNIVRNLNIINCTADSDGGGPGLPAGIHIHGESADSNTLTGNYLGTSASGGSCDPAGADTDAGNTDGVVVSGGADGNKIGDGTTAANRNVISCNDDDGVAITGVGTGSAALRNVVGNNYLGTSDTGVADLGNGGDGVEDTSATGNNVIGNLISGNTFDGIYTSSSGGTISGNTIGLQADGSTPLGNGAFGIELDGASDYTIGGTAGTSTRNVIATQFVGISLSGAAASNTILGNYIGTDSTGNSQRLNIVGILMLDTANGNIVGGLRTDPIACTGPCNVISGNGFGVGFDDTASNNDVRGNNIGVGADGLANVGNLDDNIFDVSTSGNRIGGTAGTVAGTCLGVCNRIAHSGSSGVAVDGAGTATLIRRNEHFGNAALGIDLDDDGIDCPGEVAAGLPLPHGAGHDFVPAANGGFPACPIITAAVYSGGIWTVSGHDGGALGSAQVPTSSPVDIYEVIGEDIGGHGEGKRWLATAVVAGDGSWSAQVCVNGPTKLTAVVSNLASIRSSEFGPNYDLSTGPCDLAAPPPPPPPPPAGTSTFTPTPTATRTATATATATPTRTGTPTLTGTVTNTPTITSTPTVTNTFTPAQTFTPTRTNTPVPTATRTATPITPAPIKPPLGDVNGDGSVDARDSLLIKQVVAALIDLEDLAYPNNADVNEDGVVNIIDAQLIEQFSAGLIDTLPPESSAGASAAAILANVRL